MKKNNLISLLIAIPLLFFCTQSFAGYQKKHLEYKGYKIYYEVHGNSDIAKTLVFIHGWSGNLSIWENQLDAFPGYRLIAIDLPGHGKSSRELDKDYTLSLCVDAISAVLDEEHADKAFVFGHSMGFAVSEVFALKYPEKTFGIGSIDGAHFEVESDDKSQAEWIAFNTMMAESMNEESGRTNFINMLFLPDTPEKLKNEILESGKTTPLIIGKQIISSMSDDMSYWEKRVVNIPCFVIHSPVYQLSHAYEDAFKKMYPQAEYHQIDGVSHFLMLEIPEVVNALMTRYLNKVYSK